MKALTQRLILFALAFLIGILATAAWNHQTQIDEFLSNVFLYYQD